MSEVRDLQRVFDAFKQQRQNAVSKARGEEGGGREERRREKRVGRRGGRGRRVEGRKMEGGREVEGGSRKMDGLNPAIMGNTANIV